MKKILILLVSAVSLVSACRKLDVSAVDMDIQLPKTTYKVGDTVRFTINSDAQNITFYSGEDRSNYDNAGKLTVDKGKTQLDFRTVLGGGKRDNSLKVLVTTGLDAVNASSIASANWTDITSRATLAASTTATLSGPVDLTEFADPAKPFRLAFKYEAATSSTLAQPIWNINLLTINTTYNDGTTAAIATLANAGWTAVDIKNPAAAWTISTSQVRIDGGAKGNPDNEDWVVTGPLNLLTTRELTDIGTPIKNLASSPLTTYPYVYTRPGTYTVTFVGSNNSIDDEKKVVRQLKITVTN